MPPLATDKDVATRLGRDLTETEQGTAGQVIETVTGLIADAVERTAEWLEAIDPPSPVLRALCVERALSAIVNPSSLVSESETLGSHAHSQTHSRSAEGPPLALSEAEERMASRAVFGGGSGSAPVESPIDRLIDLREGREAGEDAE